MYIYTVTVTRVEIYTFLHDFRRTDVEHFLSKMRKNRVLHDFRMTDVDALILHKCSSGYFSTFFLNQHNFTFLTHLIKSLMINKRFEV